MDFFSIMAAELSAKSPPRPQPKLTTRQRRDFARDLQEAIDETEMDKNDGTMGSDNKISNVLDAQARFKILGGREDLPDRAKHEGTGQGYAKP